MRSLLALAALLVGGLAGQAEAAIAPLQVTETNKIFSSNVNIATLCSGSPANCNLNNYIGVSSGGTTPLQIRISSSDTSEIFDLNVNGPTQLNISGSTALTFGFAAVDKNFNSGTGPNGIYSVSFRLPNGITTGSIKLEALVGTAVVPLPAAALLFGTGLLGLGAFRRRAAA